MELSAELIAKHLGGTVEGDPNVKVSSVARIEQGKSGNLCFLANPKYEKYLYTTKASIILINASFELKEPVSATLIRVENAYQAIASLLDLYNSMNAIQRKGREYPSRVAWTAKVGKGAYIGAFAYIGPKARVGKHVKIFPHVYIGDGAVIGDDCVLYPGVKVYPGCKIGNRCILHAGVVIGSDGFGFAPTEDGSYKKIPQTGNVILEDDVEIGANTCVDRATMGSTVIHKGVKLDNLIQVAHNVEVGQHTVIAAQTGIAGSTKIGEQCVIGGQVGFSGHIHVGNKVKIGAQSGVITALKDEATVQGSPAIDYGNYYKSYAIFKQLSDLRNKVFQLEKKDKQ